MTTGVDGEGSIGVTPAGDTYVDGQSVTFQATPAADWLFVGWSGLSGSDNPATINITGNLDVTAVFGQNPTELTRTVVGEGAILADPDRSTFARRESVTLTAVAADGWVFVGWSGDLPAATDPAAAEITLSMETDRALTAYFEPDAVRIFLPIVVRGATTHQ